MGFNIKDFDEEILNSTQEDTLVSRWKKERTKSKKRANEFSFSTDVRQYWYVYVFLAISAVFTGMLGVYMGLSPYLEGNILVFQTDLPHVLMAMIYCLAFIGVTEVAYVIAKHKYFTREDKNWVQTASSLTVMVISGVSILVTGITGGTVVAANVEFLTAFTAVSSSAQLWVVRAIPALITIYTFLFSAYQLSSDTAQTKRMTLAYQKQMEIDSQTRTSMAYLQASRSLRNAEIGNFMSLVERGKVSAQEADLAIKNGWSVPELETHLNRDIDGGGIGSSPVPVSFPSPASKNSRSQ